MPTNIPASSLRIAWRSRPALASMATCRRAVLALVATLVLIMLALAPPAVAQQRVTTTTAAPGPTSPSPSPNPNRNGRSSSTRLPTGAGNSSLTVTYQTINLRTMPNATFRLDLGLQLPYGGNNYSLPVDLTYRVARYATEFGIQRALSQGLLPNMNVTLHLVDTYHPSNPASLATIAADVLVSRNVRAVLGDGTSVQTINAAGLYGYYGVPICSPFASHPSLSDKGRFPTFFRTLPSMDTVARNVVQFLQSMRWRRIALYYDESDATMLLKFRTIVSVASTVGITATFQTITEAPEQLCGQMRLTESRILLAQSNDWPKLFTTLENCGFWDGEHVLIAFGGFPEETMAEFMSKSRFASFYRRAASHILEAELPQPEYGYMADEFLEALPQTDFPFRQLNVTIDDVGFNAANMDLVIGCAYAMVSGWDKHFASGLHLARQVRASRGQADPSAPSQRLAISLRDFNGTRIQNATLGLTESGDWIPEFFVVRGVTFVNETTLEGIELARVVTRSQTLELQQAWSFLSADPIPLDGPRPVLVNPTWNDPVSIITAGFAAFATVHVLLLSAWMWVSPLPHLTRTLIVALAVGCWVMLSEVLLVTGERTPLMCNIRHASIELGFGIPVVSVYAWLRLRFLVFDTGRPLRKVVKDSPAGLTVRLIGIAMLLFGLKIVLHPVQSVFQTSLDNGRSIYMRCTPPFYGVVSKVTVSVTMLFYLVLLGHSFYMINKLRRFCAMSTRIGVYLVGLILASTTVPISFLFIIPLVVQVRAIYMAGSVPFIVYGPAMLYLVKCCLNKTRKSTTSPFHFASSSPTSRPGGPNSSTDLLHTKKKTRDNPFIDSRSSGRGGGGGGHGPRHGHGHDGGARTVQRRAVQQWTVPFAQKWSGIGSIFSRKQPAPARVFITRHIVTVEWRDRVYSEHVGNILVRRQNRDLVANNGQLRQRAGSFGSLFRSADRNGSGSESLTRCTPGPLVTNLSLPRQARARADSVGATDAGSAGRTPFSPAHRSHTSSLASLRMLDSTGSGAMYTDPESFHTLERPEDEEAVQGFAHLSPDDGSCLRVESLRFCFFLQFATLCEMLAFCAVLREHGCEGVALPVEISLPANHAAAAVSSSGSGQLLSTSGQSLSGGASLVRHGGVGPALPMPSSLPRRLSNASTSTSASTSISHPPLGVDLKRRPSAASIASTSSRFVNAGPVVVATSPDTSVSPMGELPLHVHAPYPSLPRPV